MEQFLSVMNRRVVDLVLNIFFDDPNQKIRYPKIRSGFASAYVKTRSTTYLLKIWFDPVEQEFDENTVMVYELFGE